MVLYYHINASLGEGKKIHVFFYSIAKLLSEMPGPAHANAPLHEDGLTVQQELKAGTLILITNISAVSCKSKARKYEFCFHQQNKIQSL